jgi:signal transduction histidine kinase
LRRVATFIAVAGLAAPILSSFADAAVVHTLQGMSYWGTWRVRTYANVLTELSVVPVVLLGITAIIRGVRAPSGRQALEAGLLAAGVIASAAWVFGGGLNMPGIPPTPSVLLLPFYFWAAARFGVGAVSAALFATAFAASYETQIGHRPFDALPPAESLMAVQMYLIVMGIPLMCVSGSLDERRAGEVSLQNRLRFEGLLTTISSNFVRQPIDSALHEGLRHIGEFFDADYVGLLQVGRPGSDPHVEWQWSRGAGAALVGIRCVESFPAAFSVVLGGEPLLAETPDAVPPEATADRESFRKFGVQSAAALPLRARGAVQGALSFAMMRPGRSPRWDLQKLLLVAEVFANACARRQAEMEVEQGRRKLASMARLSSVGELTASLAHQLNQPLTGIRNNAEAGQRFIDSGRATLPQLRDILADIVDDDARAAEVIRRVREMLGRSEWAPRQLDANELVQDVAVLIESDAVLRNVAVSFDFAPHPIYVNGNRIDLEQAVLNVITNAMDAVADQPVSQRVVDVQTQQPDGGGVHLVVRDRGVGIPAGSEERIFEPFVTTKPTGMGMGLTVARSVVDNHGGSISAVNRPEGGAVVTISIPAAAAAT